MNNPNCYIEFDFSEDKNFSDLLSVFEKVKAAKNNDQPQEESYWLNSFPDYSLKNFIFSETDKKPDFETTKKEDEFAWHFYSLIDLLQTNYDIEYKECIKLNTNKGRLEYYPWGYPYGGMEGLITLVKSFNCRPTFIDDGSGIYRIEIFENGDFMATDLTNREPNTKQKKESLLSKLFKKVTG
jgi:hypothetical protein